MVLDTFLLVLNGFFATGGVVKHEVQTQTGARYLFWATERKVGMATNLPVGEWAALVHCLALIQRVYEVHQTKMDCGEGNGKLFRRLDLCKRC